MEKLRQTRHMIHALTGALNFVGGGFTEDGLSNMCVEDLLDSCFRNGIIIHVSISPDKIFKSDRV